MVDLKQRYYDQFKELMEESKIGDALSLYQKHPELIILVKPDDFANYYVTISNELGNEHAKKFLKSYLEMIIQNCCKEKDADLLRTHRREFYHGGRGSIVDLAQIKSDK